MNLTFRCVAFNSNGDQVVTQWNIENFRGREGGQDIRTVLPNTILTGNATGGGLFPTFRTDLIFPVFLDDLDGTTLTCGFPPDLRSGQFHLQAYSE